MNVRSFSHRRQHGATLLVALVMLIVMTLLGLASIRGTSMQERMGANMYDRSLAFQAVESALREAESTISISTAVTNSAGLYCLPGGTPPLCAVTPSGAPGATTSYVDRWNDAATEWRRASTWWGQIDAAMKGKLSDSDDGAPEYIIEYMGDFEDGTGCGRRGSTSCRGPRYRITARMPPVDGRPNVVLQTTYRP